MAFLIERDLCIKMGTGIKILIIWDGKEMDLIIMWEIGIGMDIGTGMGDLLIQKIQIGIMWIIGNLIWIIIKLIRYG